jgi:cytochrome c556
MRLLTITLMCLAVGCATAAVKPEPEPEPTPHPVEGRQFREAMRTMEAAVLELKTTSSYDRAGKAANRLVETIPHITRYGGVGRDGQPIREKQDFRNWAAALATAAEDLKRATNKGDHEAAKAAHSEVDQACKGCHDVYGNRQW